MYSYSRRFNPPAPVLPISLFAPFARGEIRLEALVDSGADITVVPVDIVSRLRLRRIDIVLVSGLDSGAREAEVYAVALGVEGLLPPRISRVLAWGADYALLGRDVLNRLIAVLNGPEETLQVRL